MADDTAQHPYPGDEDVDNAAFGVKERRILEALRGAQTRAEKQLTNLAMRQQQTNELLQRVHDRILDVHRIFRDVDEHHHPIQIQPDLQTMQQNAVSLAALSPDVGLASLLAPPVATKPEEFIPADAASQASSAAEPADNAGTKGENGETDEGAEEQEEDDVNFGGLPAAWPASLALREAFHKAPEDEAAAEESHIKITKRMRKLLAVNKGASSSGLLGDTDPTADLLKQLALQRRSFERCMLDPHSSTRVLIDLFSLALLLYDLMGIPIVLAWDLDVVGWLWNMSIIVVSWWSFEMVANFFTGIYVNGRLNTNHCFVAMRYLKSWFFMDVLIITCDWMSLIFLPKLQDTGSVDGKRFSGLMRISKAGRLMRFSGVLMRAARLSDLFARIVEHLGPSALIAGEVFKLLFTIVWVNHVISCVWFAAGRMLPSDTGLHWLDTTILGGPTKYKDCDFGYQYLTAFHWSLTQMTPGSMQVAPLNSGERILNILCLILGVIFFSSLVSTLSAKMTQYVITKQGKLQELRTLRRFLEEKGVATQVSLDVYRAAKKLELVKRPLVFGDVHLIAKIPLSLQCKLKYELCSLHILEHPLFQWWSHEDKTSLEEICHAHMNFIALPPTGTLFLPGVNAASAYVIAKGTMQYKQAPQSSRSPLEKTVDVEKGVWVSEAALWSHWQHVGTMDAKKPCEVLVLNVAGFVKLLTERPEVRLVVAEYGRCFHAHLSAAKPPSTRWPDDLPVPSCEFSSILGGLSHYCRESIGAVAIRVLEEGRGWNTRITDKALAELFSEIQAGKCSMMIKGNGEVERVVAVTGLRLERLDGKIFVQLGVVHDKGADSGDDQQTIKLKPDCKLPGGRPLPGKRPVDVVVHLLEGAFAPFGQAVSLEQPPLVEVEESASASTGVRTRYTRTEYHATLQQPFDDLNVVKARANRFISDSGRSFGSHFGLHMPCHVPGATQLEQVENALVEQVEHLEITVAEHLDHLDHGHHVEHLEHLAAEFAAHAPPVAAKTDVYLLSDGNGHTSLFAWVSPEDFTSLKEHYAKVGLDAWFANLLVDHAQLEEAADAFRAARETHLGSYEI